MTVTLHEGDCLAILKNLLNNSISSIVTDPPYGLSDHSSSDIADCLTAWLAGEIYQSDKKGFMGAIWDAFVPGPEVWRECLRVLKPGGNMLVFAGTRSMDLMSMAIRLAGFELRDSIGYAHDGGTAPLMAWAYGTGFPHGQNISAAIDKAAGREREIIGTKVNTYDGSVRDPSKHGNPADQSNIGEWGYHKTPHGMPLTAPASDAAKRWEGWNTHLKPAWEPILICRKPLDGNMVQNIQKHGVGGLNVDACRIPVDLAIDDPRMGGEGSWGTEQMAKNVYAGGYSGTTVRSSSLGRYPANIVTDGSDTVRAAFPDAPGASAPVQGTEDSRTGDNGIFGHYERVASVGIRNDKDTSAARFFMKCEPSDAEREANRIAYCSKASPKERQGSRHPTIKPVGLLRYLCKLINPPNGIILDPFAGSGTTGQAALEEGFQNVVLIEREAEYCAHIRNRLAMFMD
jgi:DNA modification methylase